MRFALIALTLLLLASCANVFINKDTKEITYNEYLNNLPKDALEDFKATAKFNFYEEDKVISGKINWSSKNNKDIILIFNPFNGIEAKIELDLILKNQNIKLATDKAKNKKLNSFLEKNQNLFLMRKFIANPPPMFFSETKTLIKYENWDIIFEEINPDQTVKTIKFKQKNIELVLEFVSWE
jgi:hypothetical protein